MWVYLSPINVFVRKVKAYIGNDESGASGPWQVDFVQASDAGAISMVALPAFNGTGSITTITSGGVDTKEIQLIGTSAKTGSLHPQLRQ